MIRAVAALWIVVGGCYGPLVYECSQDGECLRAGQKNGRCVAAPSGSHYCAFDDSSCPSGQRFDDTAGEGLGRQCVAGAMPDGGADLPMAPPLTWSRIAAGKFTDELWSAGGYDAAHVWVVGVNGIYFSADGGLTWSTQDGLNNTLFTGVWARPGDAFVVGRKILLHSIDDGLTWTPENNTTMSPLTAVAGIHSNNLFAVGDNGAIGHRASSSWKKQTSGTMASLTGVWGASDGLAAWVVGLAASPGDQGPVLVTSDGGMTWSSTTTGPAVDYHGVWGSSAADVYVVGARNTILHGGAGPGWTTVYSTKDASMVLRGVWGSGPNDVYAVGTGGAIVHSTNGGASWQAQPSGTTEDLYGIWGVDAKSVYAVGANGTVIKGTY